MKTVTSSIALAALVALGAFVLPCLSEKHPYERLSEYLNAVEFSGGLKPHVQHVHKLINSLDLSTKLTDEDRIFRQLAVDFSALDYDGIPKLCDPKTLKKLLELVETGENYHNTCTEAYIKGRRLNELLIDLRSKVRLRCYRSVERELEWWEKQPVKSQINTHKLLETINDEVWKDKLLLKDLIYCPKENEESRNIKKHRISTYICTSIHHCPDRDPSYSSNDPDEFIANMRKDLIEHCNSLLSRNLLKRTVEPLRQILALDLIDFLGDKEKSRYEKYISTVKLMPVYLVCEWIKSKEPDELISLVKNVHELLMKDGEGSSRS